jgi:hypothetical protein
MWPIDLDDLFQTLCYVQNGMPKLRFFQRTESGVELDDLRKQVIKLSGSI